MQEDKALPRWISDANNLPLAFAQVREDALIDESIVKGLGKDATVALIASGGCTAALLATLPNISQIQLIDPNPSQLSLSRLKIRLLMACGTNDRLAILGHRPMASTDRRNWLAQELFALGLAENVLGPMAFVAQMGLTSLVATSAYLPPCNRH